MPRTHTALRRISLRALTLAAVVALVVAGASTAYFSGALSSGSSATAAAGSLPKAATPSAGVTSGTSVTVSWTQSTVGGKLLGTYSGGGYTVERYPAGGGAGVTPGTACGATITGSTSTLSCVEANVSPGNWVYKITPVLNNWVGSQSDASSSISAGAATDNVTASINPTTVGTSVTYTATVTGTGLTPTGSVTFNDGGSAITSCGSNGTVTLNSSGLATCTVIYQTTSSSLHSITAPYGGDSNYAAAAGNTVSEVVNAGTAADAVTSSENPVPIGTAVTYQATVTGAGAAPTGSVTFKDGSTALSSCGTAGVVSLDGSGVATCTTTYAATAGSPHNITAAYSGDSNYNTASGNTLVQTVSAAGSTTALSLSSATTTYGSETGETFTATVTGVSGGANPTGTVTIKNGVAALCTTGNLTVTAGHDQASCSLTAAQLGGGSYSNLTATYNGDTNYNTSTSTAQSLTVNATSSGTTLSLSSATLTYGNETGETFIATVTGAAGGVVPTGTVTIKSGTTSLCTTTNLAFTGGHDQATCSLTAGQLGGGSYSNLTATYNGDANYNTSTSTAKSLTVNTVSSGTSLSLSTSSLTYGSEDSETFTATVTGVSGGAAPTGTVTIKNGATSLCTTADLALTGGNDQATCSLTAGQLGGGSYNNLTATYNGDTNYNTSSSAARSLTVGAAASGTALSLSTSSVTYGSEDSETFTATVTGVSGGAAPAGTVTIKNGATTLCTTGNLAVTGGSDQATCSLTASQLGTGSYSSVTAAYGGDSNYGGSTSSPSQSFAVAAGKIHISALSGSGSGVGASKWSGTVNVSVTNAAGSPVTGVSVTGSWSPDAFTPSGCTTLASGSCSITTNNFPANSSETWTVAGLAASNYTYDSSANAKSSVAIRHG